FSVQAVRPASATEAPISCKKSRRGETPGAGEGPEGGAAGLSGGGGAAAGGLPPPRPALAAGPGAPAPVRAPARLAPPRPSRRGVGESDWGGWRGRGRGRGRLASQDGQREPGRFHRWHVSQATRVWTLYCLASWLPRRARSMPGSGLQVMLVMNSTGRSWGSGARWQLTHQPMLIGGFWVTTGISSIRPRQGTQPTPLFTWMEWLK